ncbi:MAG: hypothetical protein NTZ56_21310 [Acidobacteria bacterium]|nr:hypothetical protein [Acidobacteriota bacterium]
MPKPYGVIKDYYPSAAFAGQMGTAIGAVGGADGLRNLAGSKIMATRPMNFQQLFDNFVAYIRTPANGLTWDGSGRGGTGSPMLDNDLTTGECAMFAAAFQILCWAPAPYGLGLPKTDFEFVSYTGNHRKGFVSNHPRAGVVRLLPNVAGQDLYLWANHKVVRYQGRYWDVMYNTSYANKEEMALYHVMPDEVVLNTEDVPVEHRGTYSMVEPLRGGQGLWFKETRPRVYEGPSTVMPF